MRNAFSTAVLLIMVTLCSIAGARADEAAKTQTQKMSAEKEKILKAALELKIPTLKLHDNSLSDVIDYLCDVSGKTLFVDWAALEAAGVSRDSAITCSFMDISFNDAIKIVLEKAANDPKKLSYCTDGGVIFISTPDRIKEHQARWSIHAAMRTDRISKFEPLAANWSQHSFTGKELEELCRDSGYNIGTESELWKPAASGKTSRGSEPDNIPTLLVLQLIAESASNDKATVDFRIDGDTVKFFLTPVKK